MRVFQFEVYRQFPLEDRVLCDFGMKLWSFEDQTLNKIGKKRGIQEGIVCKKSERVQKFKTFDTKVKRCVVVIEKDSSGNIGVPMEGARSFLQKNLFL
jgi:hypothetical protein